MKYKMKIFRNFIVEKCYKVIGQLSLVLDFLPYLLTKTSKDSAYHNITDKQLDKTGIVATNIELLKIYKNKEFIFAFYDSLAHSIWRSQELCLFSQYLNILKPPMLDFGCGDGSFASILFENIDYAIDIDDEALNFAAKLKVYKNLVKSSNAHIPLASNSINSVISNSVLEHLTNLEEALSEINRVLLLNSGVFMFTATTKQFANDIAKYFGEKESIRINKEYYHRNLINAADWVKLLEKHGFALILLKQYQPDYFSFWYRMLRIFGKRGLAYFFPKIKYTIWALFEKQISEMIKDSINNTEKGANIFVVAKKNKNIGCINLEGKQLAKANEIRVWKCPELMGQSDVNAKTI